MQDHTEPLKVIFIGGAGRSGSTLLDTVLGQLPGFFSLGELVYIWQRGYMECQLCGCGKALRACQFWGSVVRDAFGHEEEIESVVKRALKLQTRVSRMRHIPLLSMPALQPPAFRKAHHEYLRIVKSLLHSAKRVSGSQVLVDSSKSVAHGMLLSNIPGIDLYVIHLIRDIHGVAYSWRRAKRRPEIVPEVAYMPRYSYFRTVFQWTSANTGMHLLARNSSVRYALVRYEDFVQDPNVTLHHILEHCDIITTNEPLVTGGQVNLLENHTVSGNPLRFQKGAVQITPDLEWKHRMPTMTRKLLTALSWPLLLRYKYIRFN
jgi:hypothetical protein